MADQNESSQTSNSQSATEVKGEKLYAGKYKSVEELERAYGESEKRFHEGRQERTELFDRLDQIERRISQPAESREGYGRGQTSQEFTGADPTDTALLSEFYNSPRKVIQTIEERAAAKAEQRIAERQQISSKATERVNAWASTNGDVTSHGDLLSYYVAQTPAEWSIERRLDEGAKRTRDRIIAIRGNTEEKPRADEFIDGAGGGSGANRQQSRRAAPETAPDQEANLVKHITEHNKSARKPLNAK